MRQGDGTLRQSQPLRHFLQCPFSSGWCSSTNTSTAATSLGTSCLAIDNTDAPSPSAATRDTWSRWSTSRWRSSENKTRLLIRRHTLPLLASSAARPPIRLRLLGWIPWSLVREGERDCLTE